MAEYEFVSKGPLKLKCVDGGIKKKKKKNKEAKKVWEQVSNDSNPEEVVQATLKPLPRTKAQQAFDKMQEKRKMQRIIEKASKTHKQCVEEFNNHLDKLTEHYDIPKVSWTK